MNLPAESTAPSQPPKGPRPYVIYTLIALTALGFIVQLVTGATSDADKITDLGGNYVHATLAGQWWRLLTAAFLSSGPLFVAVTLICLAQLRYAERIFGHAGTLVVWLAGVALGGIASTMHLAENIVAVGGSGGVFALYGGYLAFLAIERERLDPVAWSTSLRGVALFVAINIVFTLGAPGVDPTPLFVGLPIGALVGACVVLRRRRR